MNYKDIDRGLLRDRCRVYWECDSFSEFMMRLDIMGKGYRFSLLNPFWWHYNSKTSNGFCTKMFFFGLGIGFVMSLIVGISVWFFGLESLSLFMFRVCFTLSIVCWGILCMNMDIYKIHEIDSELNRIGLK